MVKSNRHNTPLRQQEGSRLAQMDEIDFHKVFGRGKIVKVNMVTRSYEIDFEKLNGTRNIVFRIKMEKEPPQNGTV